MKEKNYEDLSIDIDSLEEMWLQQSGKYLKAAEEYNQLHADLNILKAELDEQARQSLINDGIKITEAKVDTYINLNKEYQILSLETANAASKVKSIDQRKFALQDLVTLWIGGYYSTPRISNEKFNKETLDSAQKNQRKALNK